MKEKINPTHKILGQEYFVAVPNTPKSQESINGDVYLNGRLLSENEKRDIMNQAKRMLTDVLLKEVLIDVQNEAARIMYFSANTDSQFFRSRGMIEAVDLIGKKTYELSKIKLKK